MGRKDVWGLVLFRPQEDLPEESGHHGGMAKFWSSRCWFEGSRVQVVLYASRPMTALLTTAGIPHVRRNARCPVDRHPDSHMSCQEGRNVFHALPRTPSRCALVETRALALNVARVIRHDM